MFDHSYHLIANIIISNLWFAPIIQTKLTSVHGQVDFDQNFDCCTAAITPSISVLTSATSGTNNQLPITNLFQLGSVSLAKLFFRIVLDAGLKSYATRSESLQITACTIVALLISSIALRYIAHISYDVILHCVCNSIVTTLSNIMQRECIMLIIMHNNDDAITASQLIGFEPTLP